MAARKGQGGDRLVYEWKQSPILAVEGRFFDNWTARIEYLYLDLGPVTSVPATAPNATVATAFNSRVTDNLVRLGVNYKFDPNTIWSYD
jgi:outer membrane immunogenic protein